MKKCFGYVRVSTVKQGEGVSLEAQRDAILSFAVRNSIEIVQWFEEKETAAKAGRPIFASMFKMLSNGKAQGVVLHKVDRGARNLADWAKFAELADAGVDVHFATEALDFRSRGGRLTADIQAVIAADYIRNLREECIKGIDGRLKQGLYPFKAPIGYLDHGGGMVKTIDPIKGPLVRCAFELYASGQFSLRSLPKEMARRGLTNARGRLISKVGIEKMLRNPFYCGIIRITRGKAVYPGIHEPLIDTNLFELVQQVRKGRTAKKVSKHRHLYNGLFKCALCGTAMVAERQKGYIYYRCHTASCATKTVREEAVCAEIGRVLRLVRLTDSDTEWLVEQFGKWLEIRKENAQVSGLPMQLAQVDGRLQRLTDALVDRLIDTNEYAARKEPLLLEKARLMELFEKQKKVPTAADVQKFLELVKNLSVNHEFGTHDEKRAIIKLATSNRLVRLKNVCVEPSNWLLRVDQAIAGLLGGVERPTSRRKPDMSPLQAEKLIQLLEQDDKPDSLAA